MIYLDNNATTPIVPEVFDAMRPFLDASFGNPSSAYSIGQESKRAIEASREKVADLLGALFAEEIVFTSGGTESDNWAILGAIERNREKRHVVTTRVEHEAVRKLCERQQGLGFDVTWLEVDGDGHLDLGQVRNAIRPDTAVVSVMMANNETGVLFPVVEIAEIVKEKSDALFHVDGVNAVGKVAIDLKNSQIDLFSISAHKFHGPKGAGALYIRNGIELPSIQIGGGQELSRRAGTEAVHQIVGMGAAGSFVSETSSLARVGSLRDRLETFVLDAFPYASLNGTRDPLRRLPNTSNISFENTNGEMILYQLDEAGICVSTGSACNSADHKASPVLQAMDIPYSKTMGSIRFSLSRLTREDEVDAVTAILPKIIADLRLIAG
ncbi:MAG: cysteine desulfurase NifS [Acidobacteria bacterium]|nr:MAG: cysteine desulfurase NifS [Acidobacteriota bacterium]